LHDAAQNQPVLAGAEAANVGRKLLRQHGNGAVGEVDAGSPEARLQVKVRSRADVLGHVGDVNLQLEASVCALGYQNRIVEIPRRLAVDGDYGQRAKILTS